MGRPEFTLAELVGYEDVETRSHEALASLVVHLDDEGYELHFVGNRPMVDIEPEEMKSIWAQLQAAQKMLDAYFEACHREEWD